ncbi:1467_t:CDS:2 [Funneliformis geosporum]|nr:1467_t:CDS:2 [Funneliformis geosporum]
MESISELEYNEEEKQFLAGQITERQKQEEIAQQIEEKLNARLLKKNNKVGFEKKVEQIKQEIKNAENNSNLHAQQAFKHAKNKAESLLRELENVANENTNNTADKNKFPVETTKESGDKGHVKAEDNGVRVKKPTAGYGNTNCLILEESAIKSIEKWTLPTEFRFELTRLNGSRDGKLRMDIKEKGLVENSFTPQVKSIEMSVPKNLVGAYDE